MFKKILVPVDPSETEFATKALATTAGLQKQSGGEVTLIAVMPVVGGYVTEFLPADFEAQVELQTETRMKEMVAAAGLDQAKTTTVIRIGSVYHEVVDEAAASGTDLIVVSSHRPSMATYLIGSNAARIVRHAPCSVLVVRD